MNPPYTTTNESIRQTRVARGWNQGDLARRAACSQAAVSLAERDEGRVSKLLLARIHRALVEERESPPGPRVEYQFPSVDVSGVLSRMKVGYCAWKRSEAGGDFALVVPVDKGAFVLAVVDIAGRGTSVVPLGMHVQGWLRGRLGWRAGLPRVSDLVADLSTELGTIGTGAAVFLASIRLLSDGSGQADYEAVACGFPPPLLLVGDPPRSVPSCAKWPSLPANTVVSELIPIQRLNAPWRLTVGTDGLLARLGRGSETDGMKWLRTWQTGPKRDRPPDELLTAATPPLDDECFSGVWWDGWDSQLLVGSLDDEERHRVILAAGEAVRTLGDDRRFWYEDAVMEALDNAARHGYGGAPGPVRVRWREEEDGLRMEIEDEGCGGVSAATVKTSAGGFATMRPHFDEVSVREGRKGGTVLTLRVCKEVSK